MKKAFTLAEVLITLGIIGIIAALTIPTLVQNNQYNEWIVGSKKAYSMLSQAYQLTELENGKPTSWLIDNQPQRTIDGIAQYLKISKNCNESSGSGCFSDSIKTLSGSSNSGHSAYSVLLSDGVGLRGFNFGIACDSWYSDTDVRLQSICGAYYVDLNGLKGPNTLGKDIQTFYLTTKGIIPGGTKEETGDGSMFRQSCLDEDGTGYGNGNGCTAWVVFNGNMDYLKSCKASLSWTGAQRCD